VGEEALALDDVEDGEGGRAGERRAAEGRAVHPGLEQVRRALPHPHGADREPAAEALGHGDRVGADPACSKAKKRPVLPAPHCTSSMRSRRLFSSHSLRSPARNSAVQGLIPPSPWIVSTKIEEVSASTSPAKLSMLFRSPKTNPGTSGRNPFWTDSFGVALIPPNMRPWKPFFAQTTLMHLPSTPDLRTPWSRESFIIASSASPPLLQKKTRPGPA
jgi:hypothetical protein